MDHVLVSKKDLLEAKQISYGQLYRWKRKNLIPEEWFIRKSTFTGQETFFPKDKIFERIDKILNMKDGLSLDDLASMFSPKPEELTINREDIVSRNIVSKVSLELFEEASEKSEVFPFERMLRLYALDKLLQNGELNRDEGKTMIGFMKNHEALLRERHSEIWMLRKLGVTLFMIAEDDRDLVFDDSVRIAARLSLKTCTEELQLNLIDGGINLDGRE